jgi:branched-chain amino acid transport system permease protein
MPPTALILSQLFNGLAEGLLLALIATGLTVIYGTLGVINFAHGALFVVGAYIGLVVFNATGSFVLAIAAGAAVTLALGLAMERGIVRLYYDRPPEDQLLVTFGIGIVLVEAIRAGFGGIALTVPQPHWGEGVANLGFLIYPLYRLQILAISAVTLGVLYVVLYRTRLGLIVRAGIEDSLMVDVLGVNVKRAFLLVFGLGAMAAGYAGVINSPIESLAPDMGSRILVDSFVVVVIGGVGSFPGAILGGVIAGEIMSLTSMIDPAYSEVMLFAVMALVLIFRPQGLLGQEGRE